MIFHIIVSYGGLLQIVPLPKNSKTFKIYLTLQGVTATEERVRQKDAEGAVVETSAVKGTVLLVENEDACYVCGEIDA